MSDQSNTDHYENNPHKVKAEAEAETVTKASPGCNTSHLAQPLTLIKTSNLKIILKQIVIQFEPFRRCI